MVTKRFFNLKERDPLIYAYAKKWKKKVERKKPVPAPKTLLQRVAYIGIHGNHPLEYRVILRSGFVRKLRRWFEGRSEIISPRGFWLMALEDERELYISQETEFVLQRMGLEEGWWQTMYRRKVKL